MIFQPQPARTVLKTAALLVLFALLFVLASCGKTSGHTDAPALPLPRQFRAVPTSSPGGSALPVLRHARLLRFFPHPEGVVVETGPADAVLSRILLAAPGWEPGQPGASPVFTAQVTLPLRRVVTLSSAFVAGFAMLEATGLIVGVDQLSLVYSPLPTPPPLALYVGAPDIEGMVRLAPDLIMDSGDAAGLEVLERAGLVLLHNVSWQEASPLGRAEWLLLFGVLSGRLAQAQALFDAIEASYQETAVAIANSLPSESSPTRPLVLTGAPWNGVWHLPGPQSYLGSLIHDAGGRIILADGGSRPSSPLSIEEVYTRGQKADVWLNPGQGWTSLQDARLVDSRLSGLRAFQQGQVWSNELRSRPAGANDYWESGHYRPDLLLADIAAILQPGLFPAHQFVYYWKLK